MKDDRIIDLVNSELDGTNSPSDHAELTTLLESDPSIKDYLGEMRSLDQLLAAVPMVDPPPTLKSRVMNAIAHLELPVTDAATESWLDRVLAPFLRRPAWAVTYAFAIGIVVGLSVISIIESNGPDTGTVQGTIVSVPSSVLAQSKVVAGTATAGITVTRLNDELRIDLQLQTTDPATISLSSNDENPVVIESTSGTPVYSLLLPRTGKINVTLTSGEATEHAILDINGEDGL